jgi:hypothetical protein
MWFICMGGNAWDGSMVKEMEMDGDLEKLGVEEEKIELWVGIEIPKLDPIKKNLNLKLGGCSGAMGLHQSSSDRNVLFQGKTRSL